MQNTAIGFSSVLAALGMILQFCGFTSVFLLLRRVFGPEAAHDGSRPNYRWLKAGMALAPVGLLLELAGLAGALVYLWTLD